MTRMWDSEQLVENIGLAILHPAETAAIVYYRNIFSEPRCLKFKKKTKVDIL